MTNLYQLDTVLQVILSTGAIVCAVCYPLYSLLRRETTVANVALSALLLAAAALELFDLLAILHPEEMILWKRLALYAEGFLPAASLVFSLTYVRRNDGGLPPLQRLFMGLAVFFFAIPAFSPESSLFYSPDFGSEHILFLGSLAYAFYLGLLVYLVNALINLEGTFANASHAARWNIKFEILGAGSLIAALVFYYSQSLLYRTINMNLAPVRTVGLIVAVSLIAYSQWRRTAWTKIYVSRNLVYKSVVLFVVGMYLIGLGVVGEGMRYFGESFQRSILIACALAVGLGIIVLFLSEKIKRSVKVFLIKNFYQDKYDYKTQWVQFTDRLASSRSSDELLTAALACYCETFGMGGGVLYLGSSEFDTFSLAANLEMTSLPPGFDRGDPLIAFMQKSRWVIDLREKTAAPGTEESGFFKLPEVTLIIPLFLNDLMDGFIVLGRPLLKKERYNFEDFDLMKTFARQTSSALLNLRLSGELAAAKEMEVLGKISAFVIHDLKNLVYTLSLIVGNARDYITDPEFQQDMLESLGNTVTKMNGLIAKLKYLPEKNSLQKEPVDLLQLIQQTRLLISGAEVRISGSPVEIMADRDEIQKVVLNLLVNAVDATRDGTPVMVEVGTDGGAFFRVTDQGCGMPEEFMRRHLFSPFKTTKKNGLGIGLYQCKHIVDAHDGTIEVTSTVGKGSVFTVSLPEASSASAAPQLF